MRLGIFRAIGVALDRNMRHRALEVVLADAVDAAVRARKLGEIARRRSGDADHVVRRAARADGQPAIAGVLELLGAHRQRDRSEEHTSELQSLMRISYAVFCLNKKNTHMT